MNTSLNWIKALVPGLEDVTDEQYRDAMTLSGTKVECFEKTDKNLEKIVVGKILSVEKHPDADKLVVCRLDVGEENPVQIVTGAPNIKVGSSGQIVPAVLSGGRVAGSHGQDENPEDGIKIKRGKLRGVESNGMMCALEELGADEDLFPDAPEDGIYIFSRDIEPGTDAIEALGLRDTIFEYEITNNRVDCYSVLGIAREAAATFGKEFVPPEVPDTGNDEDIHDYLDVDVKDTELCKRYTARMIKNVKIAESPEWLKVRLRASGIRPINNIVDITNYVMEEYGQPMHAFDYDAIDKHKIVVRRANDGDEFVTLDGNVRKLDKDVLMICDGSKPIGIAGIMGGENSKITDDVKTMVFESACFDGTNIRKSAKRLSVRTDASGKFEKGLDPENAIAAINRACALVEELGAGEIVGGVIDNYPSPVEKKHISFDPDGINRLLGTDISSEDMLEIFKPLEIEYDSTSGELIIPTFRQDLGLSADIAEEVARFYGYDKIPVSLPTGTGETSVVGGISKEEQLRICAMDVAEAAGFSQSLTYSFESPKVFDKLLLDKDAPERRTIRISNPLGEDFSIMRTLSVNGMLTSLSLNYSRRNQNAALYELAKVYIPVGGEDELPDERTIFTIGSFGEGDFFEMKGVIELFLDKAGLKQKISYENNGDIPYLHTGRQAIIKYDNKELGRIGEVHPNVAISYGIKDRIYIATIDLNILIEYASFDKLYTGIANYPAVTRDISIVMPSDTPVAEVESVIEIQCGDLLEECSLFDIYEGEQIESGKKSAAYNIIFRAPDRTLTDDEINPLMESVINRLEEKGFELRK